MKNKTNYRKSKEFEKKESKQHNLNDFLNYYYDPKMGVENRRKKPSTKFLRIEVRVRVRIEFETPTSDDSTVIGFNRETFPNDDSFIFFFFFLCFF